jgi:hypothetical protein
MHYLTEIDGLATSLRACLRFEAARHAATRPKFSGKLIGRNFGKSLKQFSNDSGTLRINNQPSFAQHKAKRGRTTGEHSSSFESCFLVAHPFAGELPFELRKGQEDIQHESPYAVRGAKRLSDAHKTDIVFL